MISFIICIILPAAAAFLLLFAVKTKKYKGEIKNKA